VVEIDHVVLVVPDADEMAEQLRSKFGLGSERGPYHPFAGTRSHSVPLSPPAYLEFLTIEDRDVARSSEAGRRVLECEARGFGFLTWAVRVDDLEDLSRRVGIPIFDNTVARPDGTLRGWRSVTGATDLPFFIDYPNNGDRIGRWQAMYDRVGHASHPGGFAELAVGDPERRTQEWLGPISLPLRFVDGHLGIREVAIEAHPTPLLIPWPL
jgi:Glyoxalase-like domain